MTTLAISYRTISRRVKAISLPNIPLKLLYAAGLVSIACMLVWYVVSVNQLTKGAYAIKEHNRQIAKLSEENITLEANFAKIGILGNVQEQMKALGFEKTMAITYVTIIDQSFAQATPHMVK